MTFEGEHRQIPLRGIERAGQDTMITDGAMNEVIGLDMRDGSYVPYAPTVENVNLPKDTILVRWHHTSVCKNLIVIDKNLSLFFRKDNNDAWQYVCQVPSAEIAFLGNTICTTESGFYLLWQDSKYRVIEKNNYPRVLLRTNDDTGSAGLFYISGGGNEGEYTDETRYRVLSSRCDEAGYLHQMHLCRYAIQLTNGSYCYVSNPFLIQHPYAKNNRDIIRNGQTVSGMYNTYYSDGALRGTQLQYKIEDDFNGDEVLRVRVFITKGFDMFNPIRITDNSASWDETYFRAVINSLQDDDVYFNVYDIYPQDLKQSSDWQDMSLAGKLNDNLYQQDRLPVMASNTYVAERLFVYNKRLHMMNILSRQDANYRLDDFIYRQSGEKDFVDVFATASSSGALDLGNLTAIRINGKQTFSAFDIYAGRFNMNSTARGEVTFFFADGSSYSARVTDYIPIGSTSGLTYAELLSAVTGGNVLQSRYKITIWYKNSIGEELVSVNEGYYYHSHLYKLNPYISVNSKYATRIAIDINFDGVNYRIDKALKASATQNVAFYLDGDFMPISWEVNDGTFIGVGEHESEEITHMVVSEVNMPGVFNLEAYRIGQSERLVGLSFYSLEVTNENFGSFPLVVFAEDGVYLMSINSDGEYAYGTTDKIAEDVCTNADMICRTNYGILFGTEKGLMVLGGKGVEEALHHLIGEPRHIARNDSARGRGLYLYYRAIVGIENENKISDLYDELSMSGVRELIQEECFAEYDTHIGKLVIWSNKVSYAYIIDVVTGLAEKVSMPAILSDKEGGYYGYGN